MKSNSILLIDIGNTNLKWSLLQAGELSPVGTKSHRAVGDDLNLLANQCWSDIPPPDAIYLANVAGAGLASGLSDWMQTRWGKLPSLVQPVAEACGVTNGYRDPAQLGVDRWLTLLAVRRQEPGPVCIVDCGTAITVDLMDGNGLHQGGMILPGLSLMRESLLQQTRIPRVSHIAPDSLFGRDTASGVASAAINSAAALIERAVAQAESDGHGIPKLILTGSDAVQVAERLTVTYQLDRELVMKGLAAIAERMDLIS
ncbi:type III pantothenate kinase [Sedimenticola thiotaurini]|uniref:Type III pantothenate kinase n=1 Tax=Sedimenticola thiotaurini TaxID=1543721 RepID=A0A0F7K2G4_9GAMM|nr:type III pantothenate kinase [Sedimenticola thiotaurini]AKH21400.1 hypothetical protein AAY24_14720 [Sedimenticola thiotaurini]